MNPEAEHRVTARLLGLAEAVAELADECGDDDLRHYARSVVASYRNAAMMTAADPHRLAVYRYEAARLLRAAFRCDTAAR